ncbi:hypothetical protein V8C35DRAFT_313619 [Trichoderma chlorosporum]
MFTVRALFLFFLPLLLLASFPAFHGSFVAGILADCVAPSRCQSINQSITVDRQTDRRSKSRASSTSPRASGTYRGQVSTRNTMNAHDARLGPRRAKRATLLRAMG